MKKIEEEELKQKNALDDLVFVKEEVINKHIQFIVFVYDFAIEIEQSP